MNTVTKKTTKMVLTAVFAAIIIVLATTPLGYIPLGFINATTIHIPVIVGAILLGPSTGAFLGFVFGLTSCIRATLVPNLTSFCFSPFLSNGGWQSLIVCFVPRILIGIAAYYVYRLMDFLLGHIMKEGKARETVGIAVAGVAGSMTNTLLVMNLIYMLFMDTYAEAIGSSTDLLYAAILSVIIGSGVPEAIVCALITTAICRIMIPLMNRVNQ